MAPLGSAALICALITALYGSGAALAGARTGRPAPAPARGGIPSAAPPPPAPPARFSRASFFLPPPPVPAPAAPPRRRHRPAPPTAHPGDPHPPADALHGLRRLQHPL